MKNKVLMHFWPEPIEQFLIFNFNKQHGFLIFNKVNYEN